MRGAVAPALAWVESPFQLLGALEAFASGRLGPTLAVLPRQGVEPLACTVAELERLGLPEGVHLLPAGRAPRRVGGTLAVGDAFSGEVQQLLLQSSPDEVVLLDDGRSTRRVMAALVTPGIPLVRPHVTPSSARRVLAGLALFRLRRLAAVGRLRVVTALDLPARVSRAAQAAGIPIERHAFGWLRGLPAPEVPGSATIVLGTSLVANRLVEPEPYVAWIRSIARDLPLTYWAHRREDGLTLAPLGATRGVEVTDGRLPVELRLRGLAAHRMLTLPTTAATTLRLLAPDTSIEEFAVPEAWWLATVPTAARRHLVPDGGPQLCAGVWPIPSRLPLPVHGTA